MRLTYSAQVAKDMRDLRKYSEQRWGRLRTIRYIEEIDSTIHRLAQGELHGRPADSLQPGLMRALAGRHHVYFSIEPDAIFISRVVHGRMNVDPSFFSKAR